MENLTEDLFLKIFCCLDHQNLATAQQVCRKWKLLGSENILWCNLFKERWGDGKAALHAPSESKSWKDVYVVQDRCDRVGLELKIIREGVDYYLIRKGEIQRHLGSSSRKGTTESHGSPSRKREYEGEGRMDSKMGKSIVDSILFIIGDMEVASSNAKRNRLV